MDFCLLLVRHWCIYIGILEAGVGLSTLQALYKPIATDDRESVCSILAATDKYYRKTGVIYFAILFIFSLVYPLCVSSNIYYGNIFAIVMLSGMTSIISFFFQGKFIIFLQAEGKNYIIITLNTITNMVFYAVKIILILNRLSVIHIQALQLIITCLQAAGIIIYIKRNYKWIDLGVKPNYNSIAQKNSVLVHQISGLIFNNTDTLIITIVCGLKVASVYAMYTLLFRMINTAIETINSGIIYKLGQTFNSNMDKFYKLHNMFELYNMSLTFSLYCIANIFILPFMKLYTSGVTDIDYINVYLPYLFIATYLLSNGKTSSNQVINYAGHFKLTQRRSIFESVINVVVSTVCVFKWGIYGVLFGTIVALLYRTNDMIIYANKKILYRSPRTTYKRWFVNLGVFIVITATSCYIPWNLDSYITIIFWAVICCIVIIPIFFIVPSLFDIPTLKYSIRYVRPVIDKMKSNLYKLKDKKGET